MLTPNKIIYIRSQNSIQASITQSYNDFATELVYFFSHSVHSITSKNAKKTVGHLNNFRLMINFQFFKRILEIAAFNCIIYYQFTGSPLNSKFFWRGDPRAYVERCLRLIEQFFQKLWSKMLRAEVLFWYLCWPLTLSFAALYKLTSIFSQRSCRKFHCEHFDI